jgi:hypothetical protein
VPKVVVPDLKVTVPVGAVPVTLAVSNVGLPTATGLLALLSVVVVSTVGAAKAGTAGVKSATVQRAATNPLVF